MQNALPTTEPSGPLQADDDRVRLLQAIAEGLADDDAGRTMSTKALKDSLENELGPIAWP
jgi:hypothetical protein